jgi:hypothetical protein
MFSALAEEKVGFFPFVFNKFSALDKSAIGGRKVATKSLVIGLGGQQIIFSPLCAPSCGLA